MIDRVVPMSLLEEVPILPQTPIRLDSMITVNSDVCSYDILRLIDTSPRSFQFCE